jgi:VanZ family protein
MGRAVGVLRGRWAVAGFWVLVVAVAWLALTPRPPAVVQSGWDKLDHGLAFAALAVLARLAYGRAPAAWVGLIAYGALIEIVQTRVPGRHGDLFDFIADLAGIAVGIALVAGAQHMARRRRRRVVPPARDRLTP